MGINGATMCFEWVIGLHSLPDPSSGVCLNSISLGMYLNMEAMWPESNPLIPDTCSCAPA